MSKSADGVWDVNDEKQLLRAMDMAVKSRLGKIEVEEKDKAHVASSPRKGCNFLGCRVFESVVCIMTLTRLIKCIVIKCVCSSRVLGCVGGYSPAHPHDKPQ
jgi:hypothetical protein